MSLIFDNRLVHELAGEEQEDNRPRQVDQAFWSPVTPTPVRRPELLAFSKEMVQTLGWSEEELRAPDVVATLGGNRLLEGMKSYSLCYGGHQFGNWAGQLGDGRAINLGEALGPTGQRWVLQLKGAGPTPYSRRADGRAVLRSSIREFVCSEAMYHLGVPTTRALSLVSTGEHVVRDMFYDGRPAPEPGAIVCRVSPSFIRFGNFEIFAARGQDDFLQTLIDFVISRDFPEVGGEGDARVREFFTQVCTNTARMVAHWMRVGYVHGVMNTDNMSILGLTIDYGPYGWIDNYDPNWTPNTTDLPGRRYRFGHQPRVAQWNLLRLANALAPVMEDPQSLAQALEKFAQVYEGESMRQTYRKFGLPGAHPEDESLMAEAYQLLEESEVDMTLFFRQLADPDASSDVQQFEHTFYRAEEYLRTREQWQSWLDRFQARLGQIGQDSAVRSQAMNEVNPLYVPRNYLLQESIELAEAGDLSRVEELMEVFRSPYKVQAGREHFAQKRPEWARQKPGCSMLSCSS
jgi:protein adenylyltransferase